MEKCDKDGKNCKQKEVCMNATLGGSLASQNKSHSSLQQTKTPEELAEARSRLKQLRQHLDVTAMFLGQDNVGKILAKLEMDAADPPIPQEEMP